MMLRATSETAVASRVASVFVRPTSVARARPFWRATTTSRSVVMLTRTSSCIRGTVLPSQPVQQLDTLLQVQSRQHSVHGEPKPHHCGSHIGLHAHHNRRGASQPRRGGDPAQGSGCIRIDYVHRGYVHDDTLRSMPPDGIEKVLLQLQDFAVTQSRL